MAVFQGAIKDKIATEQRVDTRRWTVRMADAWSNPDDATILAIVLSVISLLINIIPFGGLIMSPINAIMSRKFLYPAKRLHNVPYRIPSHLKMPDGSTSHTAGHFTPKNAEKFWGKGVSMYGEDRETNLQVWATDSDDRVHTLILGTTGSGKTELIHCLISNTLLNNSGFIACDAKGDISFQRRITQLLRRIGRQDDLLTITYAVGSRDFSKPQIDKPSNTFNIMADTTAGMLTELLAGMLDSGGNGNDMWVGRAVAFLAALTTVLVFLRDRGEIELSPSVYLSYMELAEIERLANNSNYMEKYPSYGIISQGLRDYLITLPGYIAGKTPGSQEGKTNEQFGFITMQLTRVLNDLGYNYGHIFGTEIGDIDISDVVFNRRCMTVLLPSLERSIPTLNMLGKLIIASIKQMMASSLGAALEGSTRIIVDSRPTSADAAFRVILDEVGYMMSVGMSIIPAQARSINIAMVFAAQSFTDIKRGSPEEAEAIWANCNMKMIGKLSDGEQAETVQKVKGIAGEADQMFIDGYHQHETATGDLVYKTNTTARRERRSVIDWHDLAAQSDGLFTLIVSKTEDGGIRGGSRVIRFKGLFTGGGVELPEMYVNSFIPISRLSDLKEHEIKRSKYIMHSLNTHGQLLRHLGMLCNPSNPDNPEILTASKQLSDCYKTCIESVSAIQDIANPVDAIVAHMMTVFNTSNKSNTEPTNMIAKSLDIHEMQVSNIIGNDYEIDDIQIVSDGYHEVEGGLQLTEQEKYEIGDTTKNNRINPVSVISPVINFDGNVESAAENASLIINDVIEHTQSINEDVKIKTAVKRSKNMPVL